MSKNKKRKKKILKENKVLSVLASSTAGGFFISLGCCVNLSAGSKPLGAFLFSLGLFMIITFGFGLYTGKAGYMALKPPSYIIEVVLTLVGNAFGALVFGALLWFTRPYPELSQAAARVTSVKFGDFPTGAFALAVFCGVLMFAAVDGNRRLSEKGNFVGALFAVVMPVIAFILCGFNHCIADMGYFFISGCANFQKAGLYFLAVIPGNALGCMLIPLIKKLTPQNP